jgi:Ca-activated chloride channel homolog
MGFLTPSVWILGGLLALAVLTTYLLKPRRPTRRVPSTLLWLAAFHDLQAHKPWRRIPPTVLLLLQLLGLASLVAAVARPYVLTPDAAGLEAILLIDVSASMQATDVAPTRFEAARARAAEMIDALEPGQGMALISLGSEPRLAAPRSGDKDVLRRALASLEPSAESGNLPAALSLAASLVDPQSAPQVLVLGDGSLDRAQAPPNLPFQARYVPFGGSADNVAIAAFGTRSTDNGATALASIANYGSQARSVAVDLLVDGQRFDAQTVQVEAGATGDVRWDAVPSSARVVEARLHDPDALPLDNAAWAIPSGDRPTRVLLVSEANIFVERALGLRTGTDVTRVYPSDYTPDGTFDLVVLDGVLPPVLPTGASLLVIHPPVGTSLLPVKDDVPVHGLAAARADNPLLADVPLEGVHVGRARRIEPPAWADVVLEAPETPLLLVGEQDGRRVAVIGFDLHQSDLPLQPAFPILMHNLLERLVPATSVATPVVRVGEATSLAPLPDAQSVEVITPDGRRVPVAPPFPPQPFTETLVPGVYTVVQVDASGRSTESSFAVNFLNPRESRLTPAAATPAPGTARGRATAAPAAPREVWPLAALAAFILLAVEWWAFYRA